MAEKPNPFAKKGDESEEPKGKGEGEDKPKEKKPNPFKEKASKAKDGDTEAMGDLMLDAPAGLGGESPEGFAKKVAEDDEFGALAAEGEGPAWAREMPGAEEGRMQEDEFGAREKNITSILTRYGMAPGDAREACSEIIAIDAE